MKRERDCGTGSVSSYTTNGSTYTTNTTSSDDEVSDRPPRRLFTTQPTSASVVKFEVESQEPNPFLRRPSPYYLTPERDLSYMRSCGMASQAEAVTPVGHGARPVTPPLSDRAVPAPLAAPSSRRRIARRAPFENSDGSVVLFDDTETDTDGSGPLPVAALGNGMA